MIAIRLFDQDEESVVTVNVLNITKRVVNRTIHKLDARQKAALIIPAAAEKIFLLAQVEAVTYGDKSNFLISENGLVVVRALAQGIARKNIRNTTDLTYGDVLSVYRKVGQDVIGFENSAVMVTGAALTGQLPGIFSPTIVPLPK